jgi:elongation factor P--(R)-beta-lysine ligase
VRQRATALAAIRAWLSAHAYLEVPTPCVVPSPALEETLFSWEVAGGALRTSPEMALKRVLAAGLPRIYELGPCFRAREDGPMHRGEFLMLEWYRAGATLPDLMDEVVDLVAAVARALRRPAPGPWRRVTVRELLQHHAGVDPATAGAAELSPRDGDDWDAAFFRRWVEDVEPTLEGPVFVTDWPAGQAALATVRTDGAWPVAERFEAFLGGVELANAFQECGEPGRLRRRWEAANARRVARGESPHPVDEAFLEAAGRIPRSAGIALGVDRLVAALTGVPHIHAAWAGPGAR